MYSHENGKLFGVICWASSLTWTHLAETRTVSPSRTVLSYSRAGLLEYNIHTYTQRERERTSKRELYSTKLFWCACIAVRSHSNESELYKENSNRDFEICAYNCSNIGATDNHIHVTYVLESKKKGRKRENIKKQTYVHRKICSESTWHSYTISHSYSYSNDIYLFIQCFCWALVAWATSLPNIHTAYISTPHLGVQYGRAI